MIGQQSIQKTLHELIEAQRFPRFSLLIGAKGSGRKTLIQEIQPALQAHKCVATCYMVPDVKIDTIRAMITASYSLMNTLFVIPDADKMSIPAMNATLKITEEPPNGNYYIMTVEDESNLLDTIVSRATRFYMDKYTVTDLQMYAHQLTSVLNQSELMAEVCQTPGDVELLVGCFTEFWDYVNKVFYHVDKVSGANSFKIGESLNLQGEKDAQKYDLALFFRAFLVMCSKEMRKTPHEEIPKYIDGIIVTTRYLQELKTMSVNKQMVFDNWLLALRAKWLQYADNQA